MSSLAGAYAFYLVVERPSHRLARWLGRTGGRKDVVETRATEEAGEALTVASWVSNADVFHYGEAF